MRDFEPKVSSKISTLLEQWSKTTSDSSAVDIYPWVHMLGFDTVCKSLKASQWFKNLTNVMLDHLMFDIDPGTVETGVESDVMGYMRAWRPTYIYVGSDSDQDKLFELTFRVERVCATAPELGPICSRLHRGLLSPSAPVEVCTITLFNGHYVLY